ncbi:30S ribosomal protein S13 [Candidatus Woesearchaeota archaeon]|nr:30S ribosomal protein S13 [Candidatus Woesearchaeota archaeon]
MAFRHIVRVANTDLDGNKKIVNSLRKIKGVSFMFANAVCAALNLDAASKTGNLDEDTVKKIEDVVKNPSKHGFPAWMFNRRNDFEEGTDKHIISTDLMFVIDNDIKRLKMIRCYRGVRHMSGKPVRGQRTRSNFRRSKGKAMGVKRKKGKTGK